MKNLKLKRLMLFISISSIAVFSSCNTKDLEQKIAYLQASNTELEESVAQLESEKQELQYKIRSMYNQEDESRNALEEAYEDALYRYKFGDMRCLEKTWKDGRYKVCGAENIIDALSDGYCAYNCSF
tara:strand:- start:43029 stop:43409 length:381 start_codon:yes stop_codon:yes gene_type:complete